MIEELLRTVPRVCARKYFSFATTFANLIFFVPLSKSLSQDFGHILPETFMLKVNFRFFSHCKQPCYLPIGKTCLGSAAALLDGVSPSVFRCTSTPMETGPIDACVET